jgi:hypothetical protein
VTETVRGMRSADAFVAGLDVAVRLPAIRQRDAVLVTGPRLAGSTSVVDVLRQRLPGVEFVESHGLGPADAPLAVVFVVSAAARLTKSDCGLLDAATAHTDLVICAVSKIDLHRVWRRTLDEDRALLAAHRTRYTGVSWVATAAAPALGLPVIADLVQALRAGLASDRLAARNRLRSWEFRMQSSADELDSAASGAGTRERARVLRAARAELGREARRARNEQAVALRGRIQNLRVDLSHAARNRCASLRTELAEEAGGLTRDDVPRFPDHVRRRLGDVLAETGDEVTDQLAGAAAALDLPAEAPSPPPGPPPLRSRSLEARLTLLLGAGFGLGAALTLSRLFTGLAPGLSLATTGVCVAVGAALTGWVVVTRRVLSDRAVLDRWAGDAVASLRSAVDQLVATRVLAAEREWTTVLGERSEAGDALLACRVRDTDAELRELALAQARAAAVRDREVPGLLRALAAVRAELRASAPVRAALRPTTNGDPVWEGAEMAERSSLPAPVEGTDWVDAVLPVVVSGDAADEPSAVFPAIVRRDGSDPCRDGSDLLRWSGECAARPRSARVSSRGSEIPQNPEFIGESVDLPARTTPSESFL